ncbi:MAG: HNH endonuclease, partial [Malacoplasma sp.]|nr:HNH endonuclease [Malacoplasma sp.]
IDIFYWLLKNDENSYKNYESKKKIFFCEKIIKIFNFNIQYSGKSDDNLTKIANKPFKFLKSIKPPLNLDKPLNIETYKKIENLAKTTAYNKPNSNDYKIYENKDFNYDKLLRILIKLNPQIVQENKEKNIIFNVDFKDEIQKNDNNYDIINKKIEEYEQRKSDNQKKFRNNLMNLYEYECLLTKAKIEETLIASHIVAWRDIKGESPAVKYSINNGLILSASVDKLFDNNIISFDEQGKLYILKNFRYSEKEIEKFLLSLKIDKKYLGDNRLSIFEKIENKIKKFNSINKEQIKNLSDGEKPDISKIKENLLKHFYKTKSKE